MQSFKSLCCIETNLQRGEVRHPAENLSLEKISNEVLQFIGITFLRDYISPRHTVCFHTVFTSVTMSQAKKLHTFSALQPHTGSLHADVGVHVHDAELRPLSFAALSLCWRLA